MRALYRKTWIAVVVAFVAVLASGRAIAQRFARDVWVECRGHLVSERVPFADIYRDFEYVPDAGFEIEYDETSRDGVPWYTNVRVVWKRKDAPCACDDFQVAWDDPFTSPSILEVRRTASGLWAVRDGSKTVASFKTVEGSRRRFLPARLLDPHSVPMLVFLLSVGALVVAGSGALRASPYVARMSTWRPATLREDGLVESESGATLGTMEKGSRLSPGPVIVSPAALEGHDVYRSMPVLTRRDVAMGSHDLWQRGTMRRLQDARTLAVVATVTTFVALMGHVISG